MSPTCLVRLAVLYSHRFFLIILRIILFSQGGSEVLSVAFYSVYIYQQKMQYDLWQLISIYQYCEFIRIMNTKLKESAKPSRNVHSGKPELRHHQQSFLPQTSLVLSATGSLELRLVSSAILEHTNNNTSNSWLGLVIVSNDRQTSENQYCRLLTFQFVAMISFFEECLNYLYHIIKFSFLMWIECSISKL